MCDSRVPTSVLGQEPANGQIQQTTAVEIDADDPTRADRFGALLHLRQGQIARFGERFFVGRRASADDVADRREHVAKHVGADNRLAGDDPEITVDGSTLDKRRCAHEHMQIFTAEFWQRLSLRARDGNS